MSHYKPYPVYKDSGVEWLGMVPEHWQLRRLKHMARFSGGGTPARDDPEFWSGDIPWVSPKDMKSELITGAEECITAAGLSGSSSSMVPAERVLMVVRSGILKHTIPVAINSVPVALNQDMKAIWLDTDYLSSPFFMRWVQGLNDDLLKVWLKQGATVESIEQDYLSDTLIPVPPVSEREQIVQRLDRETARIDALIEKKTRFIELLREKRQALITHAVTKGLDPNVKMKDSGVEWLGEVPEHWYVLAVGRHATVATGFAFSSDRFSQDESKVRLLRGINIGVSRLRWDETVYWERKPGDRLEAYELSAGTIVLGMDRPWISEGMRIAIVQPEDLPCLLLQRVASIATDSHLNKEYLYLVLSSDLFKAGLLPDMTGLSVPHISAEQITGFRFALPPVEEQQAICEHVYQELERIDQLAQRTEHSIALLKERRSALITAAVTGQIDLREAV